MSYYSTEVRRTPQGKSIAGWRLCVVALICGTGIWLVGSQHSQASVFQPGGLSPGDTYQLLFVTAGTHSATSATVGDYNSFVLAQAALNPTITGTGDGVTYKAMVSTAGGATANVNALVSTKVYNTFGVKLADDYTDMWDGTLPAPVGYDQYQAPISVDVWTGSTSSGNPAGGGAATL